MWILFQKKINIKCSNGVRNILLCYRIFVRFISYICESKFLDSRGKKKRKKKGKRNYLKDSLSLCFILIPIILLISSTFFFFFFFFVDFHFVHTYFAHINCNKYQYHVRSNFIIQNIYISFVVSTSGISSSSSSSSWVNVVWLLPFTKMKCVRHSQCWRSFGKEVEIVYNK